MPELRYVRGEGPLSAKLMVVGEAPGYEEDKEGRPFVGPSGRLLNKFLHEAGIERSQCYVTNVVKVRPPDNKFERLREYGLSPQDFLPELWQEIQSVQPNCILALGKNSLKYLTGRSGKHNSISENRGSILRLVRDAEVEGKVVPTYHPASLLHMRGSDLDDPRARLWMRFDFERAVNEARTPDYDVPKRHLWIARNSLDVWRFLERHRNCKRVSVDIEVIYAIPICIGLAFSADEAMSFPLLDFSSAYHEGRLCSSPIDVAHGWKAIIDFLRNPDLEIVGQNFKFDHDKIEMRGVEILGRIIDIMLLHHIIYPEFPKGLDFQTSIHTREPFYKIEGREFNWRTDKLEDYLIYNARDAAVQFEIADILLPLARDFGLWEFYFGFDKTDWRYPFCVEKLHNLYRKMESVGFLYDKKKNKELKEKYRSLTAAAQVKLNLLADAEINVNSWKQVAFFLYDHLKLPSRGKGGRGTGEDVLVALMNSPAIKNEEHKEIMNLILEVRRLRKTVSTYLNAHVDFDGRMRTNYNIAGTETGRTSTSQQKPPVRPYAMGLAFQTMTKHGEIGPDLRKQFPRDPGFVYLQADSKQAEARVVFLLARNFEGLLLMDDPDYDLHAVTASWFNPGVDVEVLKKDKLRRFTGKKIRHAGNYDMQKGRCAIEFNNDAKKFGMDIQISEWKAGQNLEIFHKNDPSIKNVFHQEVRDVLDETRVLTSPFGRRREFFGNPDDHGFYKEGYAHIPQASVADNTKRAMIGIREENPDVRYVLEWHDGFLALVPEKEIEENKILFQKWMEKPIDFSECSLPRGQLVIPCEFEFSDQTFYELKKI